LIEIDNVNMPMKFFHTASWNGQVMGIQTL